MKPRRCVRRSITERSAPPARQSGTHLRRCPATRTTRRNTYRQLPGIPHNPNLVLNTLGENNWAFYRQALLSALPK